MTEWSPPPELLQPLPRRVRLKKSYKYSASLIPITFFGIMIFAVFNASLKARQMEILKHHGVSAEGYVTRLHTESDRHGTVRYFVEYRFLPDGAKERRQNYYVYKSSVPQSEFEYLQIGQNVEVIYAPDKPGNSALEMVVDAISNHPYQNPMKFAAILMLMSGGASFLGIGLMYRVYRREKWLAEWGNAAKAVVVSERMVSLGRGRTPEVTFQFRDDTGSTVTGKRRGASIKNSRFSASFPQTMTALYDRENSARNMLYPSNTLVVDVADDQANA